MPFNPYLLSQGTGLSFPSLSTMMFSENPGDLGSGWEKGKKQKTALWSQCGCFFFLWPQTTPWGGGTRWHQGHFRLPGSSWAPRPTAPPMGIGYISTPLLPLWVPSPETACTFFSSSYLFPNMLSLKLRAPLHLGLLRSFSKALLSFMWLFVRPPWWLKWYAFPYLPPLSSLGNSWDLQSTIVIISFSDMIQTKRITIYNVVLLGVGVK